MTAADTARAEAAVWVEIHELTGRLTSHHLDPEPREMDVLGVDVGSDLARRARRWGYDLPDDGLAELARFAAALAVTEADAWESDDAIVATQAFEQRRFLLADRIVHWAVPWSDAAGRCHLPLRDEAHRLRDLLLDLGDRHRVAPLLTGDEGLYPPGEDSFGPTSVTAPLEERITSLWSGAVVFAATATSLTGAEHDRRFTRSEIDESGLRSDLAVMFSNLAARWRSFSDARAGTARLWRDLALRADRTASLLES